jgi:tetratricopeptide (TPR) repeat protein
MNVVWIELLPAYRAWIDDDAPRAEHEIEQVEKALSSRTGPWRDLEATAVGNFYSALGELDRAERILGSLSDRTKRLQLDGVVEDRGDIERLRKNLVAQRGTDTRSIPAFSLLCLDAGLVDEAQEAKEAVARQLPPAFVEYWKGRLALAEGRDDDAIASLKWYTNLSPRPQDPATLFRAWIGQAEVLERRNDLDQAIRVLQEGSSYRTSMITPGDTVWAGRLWLRLQAKLDDLYHAAGREQEARALDRQLLRLLSRADADHPILRKLKARTTAAQ